MHLHRVVPLLATLACDTGTSAKMDLLLAKDRRLQAQRAEEAAKWEALRERTAERARAVLARKLDVSVDAVRDGWAVDVMPRALAVGMVDQDSGLCAVLHYWDDALIVSSLGRPPMLPFDEQMLYAGLSDVRFGHVVHAHDDYRDLYVWRLERCDGAAADALEDRLNRPEPLDLDDLEELFGDAPGSGEDVGVSEP